jgi:hypothetical protein
MEKLSKEKNMENILNYNNRSLIRKYDNYYIRFIGGQYVELPCDVLITREEAEKIIENQKSMDDIFKQYKNNIAWTMDNFIKNGLKDFMIYEGNYTNEEADNLFAILNEHENIKYEMYECGMTGKFPENSAVKVGNVTAKMIATAENLSICESYVSLLNLKLSL